MAKTPEAAAKFMDSLVPRATAKAKSEAGEIQAVIGRQNDGFTLAAYDWEFYAEQVRKAKYDLNEAQVRPYFQLDTVLQDGVFYAANQLYGITFTERHDIPVYQPDVRVLEVREADGFARVLRNGGFRMQGSGFDIRVTAFRDVGMYLH